MATDLAEVIGGAIALQLLFGLPLLLGGLVTAAVAFVLLSVQNRGYRRFEVVIAGLLGVIVLGFLVSLLHSGADLPELGRGVVPSFDGTESVVLAAGMLGATVMPHVIYLHSALTQDRVAGRRRRRAAAAAAAPAARRGPRHGAGRPGQPVDGRARRPAVHPPTPTSRRSRTRTPRSGDTAGSLVALCFAVALLASGFASSGVGTYAGQVVMQGFLQRRIPLLVRRLVTMLPALVVLGLGIDPTRALVLGQVVLSFGIPFALVPLVLLSRRRDVMGALVNDRSTTVVAWLVGAVVVGLNGFLLVDLVSG